MTYKKRYKKAGVRDVIGTSFAGYLGATFKDLVAVFGEPHWRGKEGPWKSGDQKVRCEWVLKTGKGKHRIVFTIYDYKEIVPTEEVTNWHIGAKGDMGRLDRIFAVKREA